MDIGTHIKKQKSFTNTKLFYGERKMLIDPFKYSLGLRKVGEDQRF